MVHGTLRHWLAVIAYRNTAFSIRHEGTHHDKFIQSSRMSYILIIDMCAIATSDVQSSLHIYQQLMRSTWRIETIVLPEQSRTMAYTPRKTVYRLALEQLISNKAKFEGQSFPICLPYLGVVFGLSTICNITVRESGTELQ